MSTANKIVFGVIGFENDAMANSYEANHYQERSTIAESREVAYHHAAHASNLLWESADLHLKCVRKLAVKYPNHAADHLYAARRILHAMTVLENTWDFMGDRVLYQRIKATVGRWSKHETLSKVSPSPVVEAVVESAHESETIHVRGEDACKFSVRQARDVSKAVHDLWWGADND